MRGGWLDTGSTFTRIVRGEIPARVVWSDEHVVAFLSNAPLSPGHTLVVPREEVDYWVDLEPGLLHHVMSVAQEVAKAIHAAFRPVKVGMVIAGIEVRHAHVHLAPIDAVRDLDFARQDSNPDPAALDAAADRIRAALRELGHTELVSENTPPQ